MFGKLKEKLKKWLEKKHLEYEDLGAKTLDKDDDYPDFIKKIIFSKKSSLELLRLAEYFYLDNIFYVRKSRVKISRKS